MKIVFGCDPNATEFKLQLMEYVKGLGHEVADLGSDDPIYANTAIEVAKAVAAKEYDRGIIVCGTGIGVSIAANKVKGIRAAVVTNAFCAKATREHNDANMMAMGGRVVGPGLAMEIVDAFLDTPFSGAERHARPIEMIGDIEKKYNK